MLSVVILGAAIVAGAFGQTFSPADLPVIGLLVVLEGVLSIDNALVLGILAKRLSPELRGRALFYGLAGAVIFRFLAITMATFLLSWNIVKLIGGGYLLYIAIRHLFFASQEKEDEKVAVDSTGHVGLVDAKTGLPLSQQAEDLELEERMPVSFERQKDGSAKFWPTVFVIELTDIAFAVDSILAAIALVGPKPPGLDAAAVHPKIWVVMLGGILGVVLMRFAASMFIKLLEKFPRLELSAYFLVAVIGAKLLADYVCNSNWTAWGWDAHQTALNYHQWLQGTWPLGASEKVPAQIHLADFHDWRRPEFLTFWLAMLVSFVSGFLPERTKPVEKADVQA